MERLVSLSHEETRSLLVKYFSKVIDLRIEFRKQDIAFSDLEVSVSWKQNKDNSLPLTSLNISTIDTRRLRLIED